MPLKNNSKFCYSEPPHGEKGVIRRAQAHVLRSGPEKLTVFPGYYIEVALPPELHHEKYPIAVEPRPDHTKVDWPSPRLLKPVNGKVRIFNDTAEIHSIPRKQHFCQAMPSVRASKVTPSAPDAERIVHPTALDSHVSLRQSPSTSPCLV